MESYSGSQTKHNGLSKSVIRHGFRWARRTTSVLPAYKQAERCKTNENKRRAEIQSYTEDERNAVAQMDIDAELSNCDVLAASCAPPPGEEGYDISHEGGEYEVFEEIAEELAVSSGCKRIDSRTRSDRIVNETASWELQIEKLVAAYLLFRSRNPDNSLLDAHEHGNLQSNTPDANQAFGPLNLTIFIEVLDIHFRRRPSMRTLACEVYANETLIRNGYLGCAPLQPTIAFSLRTLEAYRQSHRTSPRFSIEAQCKTLCHMHNVPYHPHLATQFSNAYDAYLDICRRVDRMVDIALGFNTPALRILRSCPACFYRLEDEPPLKFSCLVSMDGNNSLKRVPNSVRNRNDRLDSRKIVSDRWLTPEEVDRFKDEVKPRIPSNGPADDSDDWVDVDDTSGSIKCTDRWRNAGPEEKKKMFALFDESGIFIGSCRHRMVLTACDMIKSGELSKYAFAVVDRLIETIGPNIGCAYDIGCAFSKTLEASSLHDRAQASSFRLMVGAFHGHAHNRLCQLEWHPLYIEGTGRSDGEGCEHIFSSSNDIARGTRHATRFHRHQAIDEHFDFWNQDKYANLSQFIYKHYEDAVSAICTLEAELAVLKEELKITDDDFERYLMQEKAYLQSLKAPSPITTLKINYLKALNDLSTCTREWSAAHAAANGVLSGVAPSDIHAAIARAHRQVDTAYAKLQHAETLVGMLETSLNIETRWTASSAEYQEFHQQHTLTNYSQALDELERLIVMRLFELAKMSTSGTGYKLRRQIGKALQRRSEAIRNALNKYNTQAAKLDPPRPALSWKEIVDYSFLGEFDLLRHSRADIRAELWTQPARREATIKYFKLCRAREELTRLNIEIRRLRTSIHDETLHTNSAISLLAETNPPLSAEISRRWALRAAVNRIHLERLNLIERSKGFTGSRGIGVRLGSKQIEVETSTDSIALGNSELESSADDLRRDQDEAQAIEDIGTELARITDFVLEIRD